MSVSRFNIRVYGLLFHNACVLASRELIRGVPITKFPGGGMQPGEGTLDCLRREIQEEMAMEAGSFRHFYTTDHFQASRYDPRDQVISIYYTFRVPRPDAIVNGAPAAGLAADPGQKFQWIPLAEAKMEDMDLPIDRVVMKLVLERFGGYATDMGTW